MPFSLKASCELFDRRLVTAAVAKEDAMSELFGHNLQPGHICLLGQPAFCNVSAAPGQFSGFA